MIVTPPAEPFAIQLDSERIIGGVLRVKYP
jgi:hypothetical protein